MAITPLPQFEEDLRELEAERKARDAMPSTVVVRYGLMKLIGEFPFGGRVRPGCGSKLVVRTNRGTELGELLTSTCPNSGCGSSVSRKQMLEYIDRSGGRDYPFTTKGKALRVATKQDLDTQAAIEQSRHGMRLDARRLVEQLGLDMKIAEVEPLLGGERIIFYYLAEHRVDLSALTRLLREQHDTRIEFQQVGARDEARLTADYERCGQYCCCKNFLKVLKPVSMRSAKTQKATLDPLKISGRCGRLMCCLRYEDKTYEELRKRLPHRKKHVGTPEGDGIVIDTQILTQLVRVLLDGTDARVAIPVEDLTEPTGTLASDIAHERQQAAAKARRAAQPPAPTREPQRARNAPASEATTEGDPAAKPRKRRRRRKPSAQGEAAQQPPAAPDRPSPRPDRTDASGQPTRKKRRRRRRKPGGGRPPGTSSGPAGSSPD